MANRAIFYIVEQGNMENMAQLLAKSITRAFPEGKIDQFCFKPRKIGRISRQTLKIMEENEVCVIDEPLNVKYPFFPMFNKVLAGSYMEAQFNYDQIVFLDTDTILLKPIEFIQDNKFSIAVKPDDLHHISPLFNKKYDDYWKFIYSMLDIDWNNHWTVESTVSKTRMYPYFNSGVIMERSGNCFFQHWERNFKKILRAKLNRHIRHFQYYFFEQSVMSATITSGYNHNNIQLLTNNENFPVHQREKLINENFSVDSIRVLHYHGEFHNLNWMDDFHFDELTKRWLVSELPLKKQSRPIGVRLDEILSYQLYKLHCWTNASYS